MKRCIVTGGTGFIGANLVRRLLRDGQEVHLLVRRECNPWRIEPVIPDVRVHETDLLDREGLSAVVHAVRPDWVFHLAVYGAYSWQADLSRIIGTNILGTVNLVEACAECGFEAFVNTGSSSEYGRKDHPPSEDEYLEPNSYYAVSKAGATQFCRYVALERRLHIPTLRLYSVYGPYEEPTRLIPMLILHGLRGGWPPMADPDTARDFVYIDDIVDAYLLATGPAAGPGGVFNLGTGRQISLREAAAVARAALHIEREPEWGSMEDRKWDTSIWVANSEKARRELGWLPKKTFEQGFARTVDWMKSCPGVLKQYCSIAGMEVKEGLYG